MTIVSGLPRSGTSMMMKMLEAGGISPSTDNLRQADSDNPKGYYEFEPAKKIKTDQDWLKEAEKVNNFLPYNMDTSSMASIIDSSLYRQCRY